MWYFADTILVNKFFSFYFSCNIDWKKGKNVTQKVVKKKQKKKGMFCKLCRSLLYESQKQLVKQYISVFYLGSGGRGQTRFVSKTIKNDSFFNFFSPPEGESSSCHTTQRLVVFKWWFIVSMIWVKFGLISLVLKHMLGLIC